MASLPGSEVEERLERANVPVPRVYTIADIFGNAHYRARDMLIEKLAGGDTTVVLSGVVPKLSRTPGKVREAGAELGSHTRDVLSRLLELRPAELDALEADRVIRSLA